MKTLMLVVIVLLSGCCKSEPEKESFVLWEAQAPHPALKNIPPWKDKVTLEWVRSVSFTPGALFRFAADCELNAWPVFYDGRIGVLRKCLPEGVSPNTGVEWSGK